MAGQTSRRGFHLLDIAALVVGYGMASLLIRAFWPSAGAEGPAVLAVLGLEYLWLGLAMSGPLVLYRHRRPDPDGDGDGNGDRDDRTAAHTWAELAWLIIGFYWIGMTVLVVPVRLPGTRLLDAGFLGVFPILAALLLRFFSPRKDRRPGSGEGDAPAWTHTTAVGLLVTWPLAWAALILLGKTLL